MSITVHIPPLLQTLAEGHKQVDVDGNTVVQCLEAMVERYPDLKKRLFTRGGKVTRGLNIYINGKGNYPDVLNRQVKSGDEIHLAYLIFGG